MEAGGDKQKKLKTHLRETRASQIKSKVNRAVGPEKTGNSLDQTNWSWRRYQHHSIKNNLASKTQRRSKPSFPRFQQKSIKQGPRKRLKWISDFLDNPLKAAGSISRPKLKTVNLGKTIGNEKAGLPAWQLRVLDGRRQEVSADRRKQNDKAEPRANWGLAFLHGHLNYRKVILRVILTISQ